MTKKKDPKDLLKEGRKPFFETPEQLQEKINDYFINCPDKKQVMDLEMKIQEVPMYTVCGLALHCGFSARQSLYEYEQKPEFTDIIKKAKTYIEKHYELMLRNGTCTGAIFALKNMGWRDKTEQEITGKAIAVQKVFVTKDDENQANKIIDELIGNKDE